MGKVLALGFAAVCGVVFVGVDYDQQSRRAGLGLGQLSLAQYGGTISTRLSAVSDAAQPDPAELLSSDQANNSAPADLIRPGTEINQDPTSEPAPAIKVNKGLGASISSTCVRRGTILVCS